jgi:hypothetical protein
MAAYTIHAQVASSSAVSNSRARRGAYGEVGGGGSYQVEARMRRFG